jgi:4-amino-4-deoxy-L-arabinose transferase-like glycosyltransferase
MDWKRPVTLVVLATLAALAVGTAPTPLWDEDEARFATIARAMVETGDWIVPRFNDSLAVDKPVLMHWCMAACMTVFGTNEFAARLPSMIATLLTGLALLRAGRRWFDESTGVVAALAHAGCLLVAIEAHAATPDAILTALTAWATVLAAEALTPAAANGPLVRLGLGRALGIGLLLGLAVVCKGPIGYVAPLAVVGPWAWCLAVARRTPHDRPATLGGVARAALPAIGDVLVALRPFALTAGAVAAAAPWYLAVTLRTDGAWTSGFFFVHNVGRFLAPMEKHGGGVLFHPLTMLVGLFPWSCFVPFAVVVAAWRTWRGADAAATRQGTLLALVWLGVWVGAFSAAATKLPNYVLPAYPAAALIVAGIAVALARRAAATQAWPHPRWLATGVAFLVFGGAATMATVVLAARHGIPGAEPAAVVGLVPLVGAAACWMLARRKPSAAVAALCVTGLVYSALMVGPAQLRIATANTIPDFVRGLRSSTADGPRIGTYQLPSPNVVFYAGGHTTQIRDGDLAGVAAFLRSAPDALLLLPERQMDAVRGSLPAGHGVVARTRPVFRQEDVVAVGRLSPAAPRTAATPEVTR